MYYYYYPRININSSCPVYINFVEMRIVGETKWSEWNQKEIHWKKSFDLIDGSTTCNTWEKCAFQRL